MYTYFISLIGQLKDEGGAYDSSIEDTRDFSSVFASFATR